MIKVTDQSILDQLNGAENPQKVTDPELLKQLDAPLHATDEDKAQAFEMIKKQHPRMPEFMIKALMPLAVKMAETPEDTSPGTATGAFLRSAIRTPLEGAENLASLVGLPVDKNHKWPSLIAESESDKSHPFAELGGSLAGFLAPGAGSVAALRSIPMWGKIAEKAAPSLLRRLPVYATEGAALGAGFSPEGHRGEGALTGAALGAAGSAIPSIGRGFGALKERISSLRNLDKLKSEGKITAEHTFQAVAEETALQDLMKNQGLGSGKDVGKLEAELPEHRAQSEQLKMQLAETPEVNTANMLGAPEGENLVPQAESLLKTSEQKAAEAEQNISKHLGEGEAHDVRAAKALNDLIKGKKAEIGDIYKGVDKELKDTHVMLPRGREINQITNDIQKAIKDGGYGSKEVEKLAQELEQAQKGKDLVPGDNFLAMYRSTRSLANKAARNSRKTDIDALDRKHWEKQNEELTETADKMNDLLKNHMSEESYADLQEANHRWRTEITPLYKNKLYYQITKEGRLPSDIINQVRGTGEGQEILRNMIKSDPEILKNVVGQRYASNPKKLQAFDELSHEFIKEMPELQQLRAAHKEALQTKKMNEESLVTAKEKAKAMKAEADRVKASFEETQKEQAGRQKTEGELKELNQKIADLERYIPELKKKAKVKNITLEKKLELESKIAKAEKDIEKFKKHLWIAGAGLGGLGLGAMGFRNKPGLGQRDY